MVKVYIRSIFWCGWFFIVSFCEFVEVERGVVIVEIDVVYFSCFGFFGLRFDVRLIIFSGF